ncbi:outer arm dynein light chain 1 [Viridothelium virens]|uniref:Outer arm dynein light chain 1 n=1 Tax=Viridothelium virens TaxID=1048519 RepID=A0A6A6HIG7_VIRVR|nr:outer arm dynein light chain 1 [Viridothelium virens]
MEEEIDLPELSLDARPLKRSRVTLDDVNTSSDPIFSSDGPEPSADDYLVQRISKRQFRGAWWDNDRPSKRIGISRKIDSGIYMGSDETDDSLPDTHVEALPLTEMKGRSTSSYPAGFQYPANSMRAELPLRSSQQSGSSSQQLPANEECVRLGVLHCVEHNSEMIDLSDLELESVPDELLEPLQQIIKLPRAEDRAPSPELYRSLAPALQLYLSANRLRSIPSAILNLEHLTVLSLRGNKLVELPGSIGRLRNLVSLNVANNLLRWLPFELLDLLRDPGKLTHLYLYPNPFLQVLPQPKGYFSKGVRLDVTRNVAEEYRDNLCAYFQNCEVESDRDHLPWVLQLLDLRLLRIIADDRLETESDFALEGKWNLYQPVYLSKSDIDFYNADGSLASNLTAGRGSVSPSSVSPSAKVFPIRLGAETELPPQVDGASSVPSLFELALRTCSASPFFSDLRALLPKDIPESVSCGLQVARETRGDNAKICTICGRPYIIRRTEWIEFWYYRLDRGFTNWEELFVPFLRQGCSWKCVG